MQDLIKKFCKEYGIGALKTLNEEDEKFESSKEFIPTGLLPIDYVFGRYGVPLGRIIEIFGRESVGKSALLAALLGMCQHIGGLAVLADAEHSYDSKWADLFGISPKNLLVLQPGHLQELGDQIITLYTLIQEHYSSIPVIIGVDSLAAIPSLEEVDEDLSDKGVASHARILSKILRRITDVSWQNRIALVWVNQEKERPMMLYGGSGVSKIGGRALDFHAAIQLRLKRTGLIKKGNEVVGINLEVHGVKNKVGIPYKSGKVDYYFDTGFDDTSFILELGSKYDLWIKKGAGYYDLPDGTTFRSTDIIDSEKLAELERKVVFAHYGEELGEKVYHVRHVIKERTKSKETRRENSEVVEILPEQLGELSSDADRDEGTL